ncbi:MAG: hypothetical protein ACPIOQ_27490 [Promethearchaeia archaeon]
MGGLDDLLHAEEDEPPQLKKLRERRRQVTRFVHGICICFVNSDCNLWPSCVPGLHAPFSICTLL